MADSDARDTLVFCVGRAHRTRLHYTPSDADGAQMGAARVYCSYRLSATAAAHTCLAGSTSLQVFPVGGVRIEGVRRTIRTFIYIRRVRILLLLSSVSQTHTHAQPRRISSGRRHLRVPRPVFTRVN